MTTSLNTEMQDNGDLLLTTTEGVAVGWIYYDVNTRRFEPVLMCRSTSGATFRSLEAAKLMALALNTERVALQEDEDQARKVEQSRQTRAAARPNNTLNTELLRERAERGVRCKRAF